MNWPINPELKKSFHYLSDNNAILGFPKLISYGVTETQNYIVTELLGTTLKQTLKDRGDGPFSIETVCLIGLQLVSKGSLGDLIGAGEVDDKANYYLDWAPG